MPILIGTHSFIMSDEGRTIGMKLDPGPVHFIYLRIQYPSPGPPYFYSVATTLGHSNVERVDNKSRGLHNVE